MTSGLYGIIGDSLCHWIETNEVKFRITKKVEETETFIEYLKDRKVFLRGVKIHYVSAERSSDINNGYNNEND